MRLSLTFAMIMAAVALLTAPAGAQTRTRVTIYTASEIDQLGALKAAMERDLPDIEVTFVRDSTGVLTARLIAERTTPRADMIFGIVTSSLVALERLNVLEPYRPQGVAELKPHFRDPDEPYTWTGLDAFVVAICFNAAEAARAGLPRPERWEDLARPDYRGQVVMPHPVSSGTGFLLVATWILTMGEEKAWAFMEELNRNVSLYTHSGSAPCVQASRGERAAGLSFDMRAVRERTLGAPIEVLIPREGVGWEMGGMALVRGRPPAQTAAAKRIADWAVSHAAHELFARFYGIVAHNAVAPPVNYPTEAESRMLPNHTTWMAENRDRILAEWTRRFENPDRRN